MHKSAPLLLLRHLLPSILLLIGLSIFTQSFFLSRTSFDHRSSCDIGSAGTLLLNALNGLEQSHIDYLRDIGFLADGDSDSDSNGYKTSSGCWTPRRVDSMILLVVDALRFDFARDHLPLSIGSRLFSDSNVTTTRSENGGHKRGMSKLYQFVADPPTVTMQRLKGLTTGGLPTFADISGSFGGASVDEDSWVEQIVNTPWNRRHHAKETNTKQRSIRQQQQQQQQQLAFVGDDTWVDLFPTQFDDCHPYPSFNTRDLDTVDNGCLNHLPRLLDDLIGLHSSETTDASLAHSGINSTSNFELVVAHFLGVDHVGHTYGPNNPHMERKLHQMDVMLSNTLDTIDNSPDESCIVALVLGDHGMTEDGNHGGGTSDEVNAGLFVHFSPGCPHNNKDNDMKVDGSEMGTHSARVFDSIHQIDLVPTISMLLGLPVPYANIGGLVPDLLPAPRAEKQSTAAHIATALALNAAQVWNYLHTYSQTSRDLPRDRLNELKELLDSASLVYRDAIIQSQTQKHTTAEEEHSLFDSTAYRQACALFKSFLAESTDLGKQVWTQFNESGMIFGIGVLLVAWIMAIPLWKRSVRNDFVGALFFWRSNSHYKSSVVKENLKGSDGLQSYRRIELVAAVIFMIFQCGVLTFGNSYIEYERDVVTFFLSVLCLLVFQRWCFASQSGSSSLFLPLIVALCSRMNDLFVTGHGLDPSIVLHGAHHHIVFLSSLVLLVILRMKWLGNSSVYVDVITIICTAGTWWEKRSPDHSRNGFIMARAAVMAVLVALIHSLITLARKQPTCIESAQLAIFRALLFVMIVTGPSAASTSVMIVIQCASIRFMMEATGPREVSSPVMAAIWRLAIRHVFFATNHHCSFNRLHFSAAFVATDTFQFYIAGWSLFMNTFGWEILGSVLLLVYSRSNTKSNSATTAARRAVWDWFCFFQWTEILASCISVSMMKRHLMVWAIFAPRFMFAAVFTVINFLIVVLDVLLNSRSKIVPDT